MTLIASGATIGPDNHAAWLAERRSGIGASEAAAVLGVCPYTTPRELYLRKIGALPDREDSEAIRRGRHMEAFLAAEYRRRFPEVDLREQVFCRHPEHRHLIATLDGIHADKPIVVEFKTASGRLAKNWGAEGSDEVPEYYLCQVQHQMEVSGATLAHVFASIGGDDCRLFVVPRNEVIIGALCLAAEEFWERVVLRDPPPLSDPSDNRFNPVLFPEARGTIALGEEVEDLVGLWESAKNLRSSSEDAAERYRAEIIEALGSAEAGSLPDGRLLTRKIVTRKGGTRVVRDSTFTDLRIKEAKRHG